MVRRSGPAAGNGTPSSGGDQVLLGPLALAILSGWRGSAGGLLVVTDSERRAERLASIVHALDPTSNVLAFPRWDRLPFDRAPPSREILGRRASVLRRLAEQATPPLLITTPEAILQRLPARAVWADAIVTLDVGRPVDLDDLQRRLDLLGYRFVPDVDEPGEAAFQGQVIDIFPAGSLGPVRIELGDGVIRAIAAYDPASQRTTADVETVVLDIASEMIARSEAAEIVEQEGPYETSLLAHYPRMETVFDYVPGASLIVEGAWTARAEAWLARAAAGQSVEGESGEAHAPFYLSRGEWSAAIRASTAPLLPAFEPVPPFALEPNPPAALRRFLVGEAKRGQRIVLAAADRDDGDTLERVAESAKLKVAPATHWEAAATLGDGACASLGVDLDKGFILSNETMTVVSASDLLGSRARHATPFDARRVVMMEDAVLRFGDAVLHLEHGVGLLRGIETINTPDVGDRDVIRLAFAGGTDMLAPVSELAALWRYSGDAEAVILDRLNGEAWRKRRQQVEADIDQTASGLLAAASARLEKKAPVLRPPPADYERFVSGFPFTETPDQASAVADVLDDLASGIAMDRLICGDVGFGKTEVALRAAAAVLLSGKQVVLIAPTTVLVRQHAETFARRFAPLGMEVAQLSRLVTPAEARRVKRGLMSGEIRLVVGTHALAAKGVAFADVGLVIIDEEQRFGARDKEKVRGLATGCHLLVLTATPIPRTLMAARVGLQSLSLLATPPARRVPVRTSTIPMSDESLRAAIVQEQQRGGQTFLVCPRVEDIAPLAERLGAIVPDVRVKIVHGQLPPDEVDESMVAFANGDGDVLLATNIIESGLDVPRANTILIVRPDRFGLAQLHQLRGRVGRGTRRGKAFLLETEAMAASARKRLGTFVNLGGIGAGFDISAQDMDQRGAGDLLGETQAGHVKLLGADLHRHLLEQAIKRARGETTPDEWVPDINIAVAARLPPEYVSDPELRLNLYRRLAGLRSIDEIAGFREELEDRFGPLPEVTEALLDRAVLEQHCRDLGIMRVDVGPLAIALSFMTSAHRPSRTPPDAEWKGERMLIKSQPNEPPSLSAVTNVLARIGAGTER